MTTEFTTPERRRLFDKLDRALIRARLAAQRQDGKTAGGDLALTQQLLDKGTLKLEPPSVDIFTKGVNKNFVPPTVMTRAAVLVPLVEHAEGPTVLLTQRRADLSKHAGQVAFPGGRMDPDDADEIACALREAREETGLDPAQVEVLGQLGTWTTGTGFEITPVVGAVTPPLDLRPDPAEVAAVFEVPLAFLLDPINHKRVAFEYNGMSRAFYEMPYEDRYIWGATAGMLLNLYYALID